MPIRPIIPLVACLALFHSAQSRSDNELPDFYADPGIEKLRELRQDQPFENIDPVAGVLNLQFTDFYLPGNGGLDIAALRYYNNLQANDAGELPAHSVLGLGWDLHFGRVILNAGVNNWTGCNLSDQVTSDSNPILELPGGARSVLVRTSSGGPYAKFRYITKDFWGANCGNDNSFLLTSPEGIQYKMNRKGRISSRTEAWFVTEVKDTTGNTLTLTYSDNSADQLTLLKSVTSNDGRALTFSYSDEGLSSVRLSSIQANNKTYSYQYEAVEGISNRYRLSRATSPTNAAWRFQYYTPTESLPSLPAGYTQGGRYSLKKIDLPAGGSLEYVYQRYAFDSWPSPQTTGLYRKTSRPVIGATGEWTYSFDAFRSNLAYDLTTITAPEATYKYQHYGVSDVGQGSLWRFGLLVKREVFERSNPNSPVETREYQYASLPISWQNERRPTRGLIDAGTSTPLLTKSSVTRNGLRYDTEFKSHNSFAQPRQVDEYPTNTTSNPRTTINAYYENTSTWIVRGKTSETTLAAGRNASGQTIDASTRWEYDSGSLSGPGLLTKLTKNGLSTTYAYYANGDMRTMTDGKGNVTTYSNYKRGIPQTEAHPEGMTLSRVVNDTGTIASETDGESNTTRYTYDNSNRLLSISYPRSSSLPLNIQWDLFGYGSRRVTRSNFLQDSKVDGFGRIYRVESKDTQRPDNYACVEREYDPLGKLSFESYPESSCTRSYGIGWQYDALGRPTAKSFIGSTDAAYFTYDTQYQGEYLATTRETNERGYTTVYGYRAFGNPDAPQLMRVETPEAVTTAIQRNKLGDIERVTQGSQTREFRYNNLFQLQNEIYPDRATATYGYDANGNLNSRQIGSAGSVSFSYDGLNRPTRTTYPVTARSGLSNRDVERTYYRNSWLKTLSTIDKSNGAVESRHTYTYTPNGDLASDELAIDGLRLTTGYEYDSLDFPAKQTLSRYPGSTGQTEYHLQDIRGNNAFGWATSLYAANGARPLVTSTYYHANGQNRQISFANGQRADATLNARRWLERLTLRGGSITPLDHGYQYEKNGNIRSITDYVDSSATRNFSYDRNDRLTSASGKWGTSRPFTYDANGNLLTQDIGDGSYRRNLVYAYSSGRLSAVSGATRGSRSYNYDDYGNVTSDGLNTFGYDDAGQLRALGGTNVKNYTYDGDGRRIKQFFTGGGAYFLYNQQGNLLAILNLQATGPVTAYHYLGNQQVAADAKTWNGSAYTTQTTYLHTDHLGSPVAGTNSAGQLAWREYYLPFGERLAPQGNRTGFTGKFQDFNTALQNFGAREYDPAVGRFLSQDPVGFVDGAPMSFNRYLYADNNPYKYTDPDGRSKQRVDGGSGAALGILIGELTGLIPRQTADSMRTSISDGKIRDGKTSKSKVAKGTPGGSRAGKSFTPKGKAEIDAANAERHEGVNVCENCGTQVVPGQKSQRGVTPPGNERQRDHIIPKSKGGDGDPSNGQILCRGCNLNKSDKL